MYRGFVDSLKGAIVLFYIDKQINEKLDRKSPIRTDLRRRDQVAQSPSKSKHQRYLYCHLMSAKHKYNSG